MNVAAKLALDYSFNNEKPAVAYLQERGLIPLEKTCPYCGRAGMKMYFGTRDRSVKWTCNSCPGKKKSVSVRKGTWLEGMRLEMNKVVHLLFLWTRDVAKVKTVCDELKICSHSSCVTLFFNTRKVR